MKEARLRLLLLYIAISNIDEVVQTLDDNHYGGSNANSLGLALGLRYEDLKDIEDAYPRNAIRRLKEVIALWLTNSTNSNPATWQKLVDGVRRNNKAAAEAIEKESKLIIIMIHNYFLSFQKPRMTISDNFCANRVGDNFLCYF